MEHKKFLISNYLNLKEIAGPDPIDKLRWKNKISIFGQQLPIFIETYCSMNYDIKQISQKTYFTIVGLNHDFDVFSEIENKKFDNILHIIDIWSTIFNVPILPKTPTTIIKKL